MAIIQQIAQRILIDQRAAADVHHAGAARQQAQALAVHQSARFLGQRAGEHQELRPWQHAIEAGCGDHLSAQPDAALPSFARR